MLAWQEPGVRPRASSLRVLVHACCQLCAGSGELGVRGAGRQWAWPRRRRASSTRARRSPLRRPPWWWSTWCSAGGRAQQPDPRECAALAHTLVAALGGSAAMYAALAAASCAVAAHARGVRRAAALRDGSKKPCWRGGFA